MVETAHMDCSIVNPTVPRVHESTLSAPPGEYDWMICTRRRCGLSLALLWQLVKSILPNTVSKTQLTQTDPRDALHQAREMNWTELNYRRWPVQFRLIHLLRCERRFTVSPIALYTKLDAECNKQASVIVDYRAVLSTTGRWGRSFMSLGKGGISFSL